MGNQGSISIELDKDPIAGQVMRGNVLVRTNRLIGGSDADNDGDHWVVHLHFYGKEKTGILAGTGTNQSDGNTRAQRCFFEYQAKLPLVEANASSSSSLSPTPPSSQGNKSGVRLYAVPFAIIVPRNLPASTAFPPSTRDIGFRIQYKLKAQLMVSPSSSNSKPKKTSHRKTMYIEMQSAPSLLSSSHNRPNSFTTTPATTISSHLPPVTLPRVHRTAVGQINESVTLAAQLYTTTVSRGDCVGIKFACHCLAYPTVVKNVEIRLLECLRWKTTGHQHHDLIPLAVVVPDHVHWVNDNAEEEDSSSSYRSRCHSISGESHPQSHQHILHQEVQASLDLQQGSTSSVANEVMIPVPRNARDSYAGQLIQVWHLVEIRFDTGDPKDELSQTLQVRINGGCGSGVQHHRRGDSSGSGNITSAPRISEVPTFVGNYLQVSPAVTRSTTAPTIPPPPSPTSVVMNKSDDEFRNASSSSSSSSPAIAVNTPSTSSDTSIPKVSVAQHPKSTDAAAGAGDISTPDNSDDQGSDTSSSDDDHQRRFGSKQSLSSSSDIGAMPSNQQVLVQ